MSGGSYDYAYQRLDDFRQQLLQTTKERRAFACLLVNVGEAMRDIEWVDSCDYSPGDEDDAIRRCLFFMRDHDLSEMLKPDQCDPEELLP